MAFNKAESKADVAVTFGTVGLICVFTIVGERLFAVADVKFPFACARIWATSGDMTLSNDNDERLDTTVGVGFVDVTDTFVEVELLLSLFIGGTCFDTDDEVS